MKNKTIEYKAFFYAFLGIVAIILYLSANEYTTEQEKIEQRKENVLKMESYPQVYYADYNIPIEKGIAGAIIIALMGFTVLVIIIILVVKRIGTRIPDEIHWSSTGHAIKFYSEHVSLNIVYGYDKKGNKYSGRVVTYPDNSYDEEDIMFIERV